MKPLSEILNDRVIRLLKKECERGSFPGVLFEDAMRFLLTDGVLPRSGLPVTSFLRLEDWVRSQGGENSVSYSATDLKNKTGEILEQILSGKTVLILKHGRPVAEIRRAH